MAVSIFVNGQTVSREFRLKGGETFSIDRRGLKHIWPDYMKRLGLTPQKQILKAYEQSPKAVQELLAHTYPEIKKNS